MEETQQEVHIHREKQLGEPVQGELVKDLHHAKVVVQHSGWHDMIPPSGYHNLKERRRRTLRNTCSSVKRSGEKKTSQMRTLKLRGYPSR
jgi:hypothetical protein